MPEFEEVFRLATNKVRPDPNALERQLDRQRSAGRKDRIRAYVAVAAVLVVLAVAALTAFEVVTDNNTVPGENPSAAPESLTFVTHLPVGAVTQTAAVVDLKGRQTSELGGLPVDAYGASVSADGSTIAFVTSPQELPYNQIGLLDARSGEARILSTPDMLVDMVAISPDGSEVAFSAFFGSNTDIFVIGTDGGDLRQLTDDPATDEFPQWSPDGTTIVYDNGGSNEQSDVQFSPTAEIWTVPAAGGAPPTQLTHDRAADSSPSFSPTGTQIAYFHDNGEIRIMSTDGTDQHRLVPGGDGGEGGFTPRWSPNGKMIAFTTYTDAYRPLVRFGETFQSRPLVLLRVVDVATHRVTTLENVGMATDLNTPQWLDDGHILVIRVPVSEAGSA
jgi:dipeptidyl aminopeptidase/acylaminoacyl peptidase